MPNRFRDGAEPSPAPRTVVLLVNLGTPAAPTPAAVRRYLGEFLHDYRVVELSRWLWCPLLHFLILPLRSPRLAKKYAEIWTAQGSPLLANSQALAQAVQTQLPELEVRLAMRYGEPSVRAVLRECEQAGRVVVLPLYPQFSASTTASVHDAVGAELANWRRRPALNLLADYHLDAAWLQALADSVRAHWQAQGRGEQLLMSFHGLPQAQDRAGDPYASQCRAGAEALEQLLGLRADEWRLSFQSRFGRQQWLQPYTDAVLAEMAGAGVRRVDVICPGFAVDCLETLEEIAVDNAARFVSAGGQALRYIPALNAAPAHAAALAALARRALSGDNEPAHAL
ncbi:MAG: ferrochelatase [Arenimonas sp.]